MAEKRFKEVFPNIIESSCSFTDNGKGITHKEVVDLLNGLYEENQQLKSELKEFEDYVYSDEKILCYTCVNCLKKGIYEVECSEKGKVDVHGSCFLYWKKV